MKKILYLLLQMTPIYIITSQASYFHHRNSALQTYPSPLSTKYKRIEALQTSLNQNNNPTHQEIISLALFAATIDALEEQKLSEFQKLLEKELTKKRTIYHHIDFLITQAILEEKNNQKFSHATTPDQQHQKSQNSFYKCLTHDIVRLYHLRKNNPWQYIDELIQLLQNYETKNISTRAQCYTAIAYMLSPIQLKIIKP